MPVTMPVSIAIVLGPDAAATPPPKALNYGNTLQIMEIPAAQARAFTLAEIAYDGKSLWQVPQFPAQSQTLVTLLTHIPAESMSAPMRSFDGFSYQVQVVRERTSIAFTWSNEDWRYAAQVPKESWEAVVALAEYIEELKGSTSPPAPLQILERGV